MAEICGAVSQFAKSPKTPYIIRPVEMSRIRSRREQHPAIDCILASICLACAPRLLLRGQKACKRRTGICLSRELQVAMAFKLPRSTLRTNTGLVEKLITIDRKVICRNCHCEIDKS